LPAGRTVLVCGHSNTVPALVRGLGGGAVEIPDERFDALVVLTRAGGEVRTLVLGYGP